MTGLCVRSRGSLFSFQAPVSARDVDKGRKEPFGLHPTARVAVQTESERRRDPSQALPAIAGHSGGHRMVLWDHQVRRQWLCQCGMGGTRRKREVCAAAERGSKAGQRCEGRLFVGSKGGAFRRIPGDPTNCTSRTGRSPLIEHSLEDGGSGPLDRRQALHQ